MTSHSTYIALRDLFAAAHVRVYRTGQTVDTANLHFEKWKAAGHVATEASNTAKAVLPKTTSKAVQPK